MQYVRYEATDLRLHCPVTGEPIFDDEGFYPSPAVRFAYDATEREFFFCDAAFQLIATAVAEEIDRLCEDDADGADELDTWTCFECTLDRLGIDTSDILVVSVTSHEMACGPVSFTYRIGIDLAADPNARPFEVIEGGAGKEKKKGREACE